LGSIAAITNELGAVTERLAYDPWGKRRYINTTPGQPDTQDALVGQATDRGYTMHEHLDEVGIIHMNGRIYDPLIGRFMSADPNVIHPYNLKDFNRYSYVWNNPLKMFDPSGYGVDGPNDRAESDANGWGSGWSGNSISGDYGIGVWNGSLDQSTTATSAPSVTNEVTVAFSPLIGAFPGSIPVGIGFTISVTPCTSCPGQNGSIDPRTDMPTQSPPSIGQRVGDFFSGTWDGAKNLAGMAANALSVNAANADGADTPANTPDPASGSDPDRGGLTTAGRAQQKHGDREGSAFDPATGTRQDKNAQGQRTVDSIVNSPDRVDKPNRFGGIDVLQGPGERGARFGPDGKFTGFLEP